MYAVVTSVKLNKDLVRSGRFTFIEMKDLLYKFMNKACTMRIPDLRMLILNNYESMKEKEFFLKQEILMGISICDLNLDNVDEI